MPPNSEVRADESWDNRVSWSGFEMVGASELYSELVAVPVHPQERIQGVRKMRNASPNGLRTIGTCRQAWFRLGG